ELEPMASRDRGHSLLAWCALSCLAAPALSQRDLAWFCAARGKLPLFGNPRLLALGISGLLRFAQSLRSLLLPSPLSSLIFLPGAKASARLPTKRPPHKPRRGHSVCGSTMLLRHPKREGLASNFLRVCFRPSAVRRMVALQPIDTSRPSRQAPAKST